MNEHMVFLLILGAENKNEWIYRHTTVAYQYGNVLSGAKYLHAGFLSDRIIRVERS